MSDSSTTCGNLVVNELLSYAAYYIHRSTVDKLYKSVERFYTPTEIDTAKDLLWNNLSETILGKKHVRKDSCARTASDANITDILNALKNCDCSAVQFVASDLERLPKCGPEELSIFSLADRVAIIENELQAVKQAAVKINPMPVTSDDKSDVPRLDTAIQVSESNYSSSNNISMPSQVVVESTNNYQYARALMSDNNKAKPLPPNKHNSNRQRPKPIVGRRSNVKIKGECRKADLFVYRVNKDTDDDEFRKLFADAGILLYKFEKVSHDDSRMKSFRVVIALNDLTKVQNEDFLPQDVLCRRFYRPKTNQQDTASGGMSSRRGSTINSQL